MFNLVCFTLVFIVYFIMGKHHSVTMDILHVAISIFLGIYGSIWMVNFIKVVGKSEKLTKNRIYRTFARNSYELYLYSDPFNYAIILLAYMLLGDYWANSADTLLVFLIRFFGTIILAFGVIWIKNQISNVILKNGTISKS